MTGKNFDIVFSNPPYTKNIDLSMHFFSDFTTDVFNRLERDLKSI